MTLKLNEKILAQVFLANEDILITVNRKIHIPEEELSFIVFEDDTVGIRKEKIEKVQDHWEEKIQRIEFSKEEIAWIRNIFSFLKGKIIEAEK